jgi:hypothetical protein
MICHDTTRGVGSFLRAIKKNGLAANIQKTQTDKFKSKSKQKANKNDKQK